MLKFEFFHILDKNKFIYIYPGGFYFLFSYSASLKGTISCVPYTPPPPSPSHFQKMGPSKLHVELSRICSMLGFYVVFNERETAPFPARDSGLDLQWCLLTAPPKKTGLALPNFVLTAPSPARESGLAFLSCHHCYFPYLFNTYK